MTVKKLYKVGDAAWIYGVNRNNTKPVQGEVIKIVDLKESGYFAGPYYIISIPTHIEPLLEIRTWENISQDENGPVGSFREIGNIESTIKFASRVGFIFDDSPSLDSSDDEDNIDPEIIHAAIEKSQQVATMPPLNLKPEKPRRPRHFRKKPKSE